MRNYNTLDDIAEDLLNIKIEWKKIKFNALKKDGNTYRKAISILKVIEDIEIAGGDADAIKRMVLQKRFADAYANAIGKLNEMALASPEHLKAKMVQKVFKCWDELGEERKILEDVYIDNRRYREVRRGNFIHAIDPNLWADSLVEGCRVFMLAEMKLTKMMFPYYKGKQQPHLLRHIVTAKTAGLTPAQARGYIKALTGTAYNEERIKNLYRKTHITHRDKKSS